MSGECADLLDEPFSGAPLDLMKRMLVKRMCRKPGSYTPGLRPLVTTTGSQIRQCIANPHYTYRDFKKDSLSESKAVAMDMDVVNSHPLKLH